MYVEYYGLQSVTKIMGKTALGNLLFLLSSLFNNNVEKQEGFLTSNYIHNKFVIEKWVNRHHFYIDEINLQKFGLAGEVSSV